MEKRSYSKSIRGKITNRALLIGLLPVVLLGAFSWFSLNNLTSTASEQLDNSRQGLLDLVVGNNLSTTAQNVVRQLDTFMVERISDAVVWASSPVVVNAARKAAGVHKQAGLEGMAIAQVEAKFQDKKSLNISPEANRFLIKQIERSKHFGEAFFTDKNGYNTALTNPTSDFVQSDEGWWKIAWTNGISVGDVEYDDSAGIWSIDISVRIDDDVSGERLGVMKTVLGVSLIQAVANAGAKDVHRGSITVVNKDGQLLAETSSNHDKNRIMNKSVTMRKSGDAAMHKVFSGKPTGYVLGDENVLGFAKSGGRRLYGSVVSGFNGFDWTVVVQQPTEVALAPISGLAEVQGNLEGSKQQMYIILAAVVMIVILMALLVARALSNNITTPLLNLSELADAISKGDTSSTVKISSDDEIGDVARAFERMRTSVGILMDRMQKAA